ncbi:MAG: PAS domain S-box protein [Dehalococcoidia bacterium]
MTKILIADDNAQNLYLLETVMKSNGYEVIPAKNGAEAMALALKSAPDIIVTDILMPVMDGFELCRRWKADERLQQIPFVFYTATYTDPRDEQFALSLGADRFVIKPQDPDVLVQIVQKVLAKPALSREAHKVPPADETEELQRYNEALFRKLEKKVLELEDVIAKQKETEIELCESEQKYRTLITQSPDGIFIVNLKGIFLAVNRIMCETLKYSEEELLAMSIWDIVPEQYIDLHKKRIGDILTGKAPNEAAEYMVRAKDGNLRYVEILSAPYYQEEKLIGFQGIARDITERKKAEDTLKESEAKYRAVIEAAVDQIFVIDSEMKILSMNSFAAGFFHKKPEDMVGKALTEIFPEQIAANTTANIQKVFATGTNTILEEILTFGDKNIWNSTSLSPMKDLNGKVIAVIGIVRDITERKQFEEDLIKSYGKTKKTLNDAINTMAKIVEMRDPYTAGHQHRVAELATAVAREMGCRDDQIEQIGMAAVIHDIGKIYVPSDILSKPGKITDSEYKLIKTHAQGGYDIVKGMDFPSAVAQSILQHHERLDGSGYPNGLKDKEICPEARILSVSDVVEAMSSHRPYRPTLGINKALDEISKNKGKLYDPDVVDVCVKLFTQKGFKFVQ